MNRLFSPHQVIIERTALQALCDESNEHHDSVSSAFLALLDDFENDRLLIVAISDHVRPYREWFDFKRRGPLAPVDTLHVGNQHRRAAHRMSTVRDFDSALTLVMCQRHKVTRMLTIDPYFTAFDIEVQLVGDRDGAGV
ncbi:hypothetical protein BH10ACT2_BH10ACT2_26270 [soil metagenome]